MTGKRRPSLTEICTSSVVLPPSGAMAVTSSRYVVDRARENGGSTRLRPTKFAFAAFSSRKGILGLMPVRAKKKAVAPCSSVAVHVESSDADEIEMAES
eukprot:scaffold262_cov230-Pinguiococcus_pyrenoidosus.AAC.13